MIYLIGLGIKDERSLTIEALEVAKHCHCFLEDYTSIWEGSIQNLEKMIESKIEVLKRSDMEENVSRLLDLARKEDIAVFIIGDALSATTHIEIMLECRKQNIGIKVLNNASIFTAIAETGLSLYKFGRTLTLPKEGLISSLKDGIDVNYKMGLHTLLLLDIGMNIKEACKRLLDAEILAGKDKIVTCHFGKENQIKYVMVKNAQDLPLPCTIIIPGKLHFKEEEMLKIYE